MIFYLILNSVPEFAGKFDLTLGTPVKKPVNYAMSDTFGFGGPITTTIVKKFQ